METWRRFRRNRLALIGFAIISMYVLAALVAPWLAPYGPLEQVPGAHRQPPGSEFWLGTDNLGRDILSRMIYGARISLQVALISVMIALAAGTALGAIAGYFGRFIDTALSRLIDVMLSLPDILLALVLVAVLTGGEGGSTWHVIVAIGLVYTPIFARIARGSVLQVKENAYVEAARAVGSRHGRILLRHILPNITAPLIIQTTLSLAFAILAEAALSFLGFGVSVETPSWGVMLNVGRRYQEMYWWMAVFPGIAITLAVFSFNVMGDGLRDALDPRLR